jgi:protein-S-isoprenylcysteine O-methyltransferase Ste14
MAAARGGRGGEPPPPLWRMVSGSLMVAVALAGFALGLGRSHWVWQVVAVGLVLAIIGLALAWGLGFQAGVRWRDNDRKP